MQYTRQFAHIRITAKLRKRIAIKLVGSGSPSIYWQMGVESEPVNETRRFRSCLQFLPNETIVNSSAPVAPTKPPFLVFFPPSPGYSALHTKWILRSLPARCRLQWLESSRARRPLRTARSAAAICSSPPVVGKALQPLDCGSGVIECMGNNDFLPQRPRRKPGPFLHET